MRDARHLAQLALQLSEQLAPRAGIGETGYEPGAQSRIRTTLNHSGKTFHGSEGIVGEGGSQLTRPDHGTDRCISKLLVKVSAPGTDASESGARHLCRFSVRRSWQVRTCGDVRTVKRRKRRAPNRRSKWNLPLLCRWRFRNIAVLCRVCADNIRSS